MKYKLTVKKPFIIHGTDDINVTMLLDDASKKEFSILDVDNLIYDKKIKYSDIKNNLIDFYKIKGTSDEIQNVYKKIKDIDNYKIYPPIKYGDLQLSTIKMGINMPIGYYENKRFIPYIPGSSIKGAMKNAIRNYNVVKKPYLFDNIRNSRQLDNAIFLYGDNKESDPKRDIMKFVSVSDFVPAGDFSLKLYKDARVKTLSSTTYNSNSKINTYSVMVYDGTFKGDIKVTPNKELQSGGKDEIKKKIIEILGLDNICNNCIIKKIIEITTNHYKHILQEEKSIFGNLSIENPIMLGFGGGIEEKTIINSAGENLSNVRQNAEKKNKNLKFETINGSYLVPSTAYKINENGLTKFGVLSIEEDKNENIVN